VLDIILFPTILHKTEGLNSNTVPLTLQFHTLDTDESKQNVRSDGMLTGLSALNVDACSSRVLCRGASSAFY
jgi:hypothetical protein